MGAYPWVERQRGIYGVILTVTPVAGLFNTYFKILDELRKEVERCAVNIPKTIRTSETAMLYPNPCSGILHVSNMNSSEYIFVYDVAGTLVYKTKASEKIDISMLSPGLYFIKIGGKYTMIVKK